MRACSPSLAHPAALGRHVPPSQLLCPPCAHRSASCAPPAACAPRACTPKWHAPSSLGAAARTRPSLPRTHAGARAVRHQPPAPRAHARPNGTHHPAWAPQHAPAPPFRACTQERELCATQPLAHCETTPRWHAPSSLGTAARTRPSLPRTHAGARAVRHPTACTL